MICATLKDAKARLNSLVQSAVRGEDVVLMRGSKHVAAIVPINEDELFLSSRLSDAQAERLWAKIDSEEKAGKLKKLKNAKDILSSL